MASIDIRRQHRLSLEAAISRVEEMSSRIIARYDLQCRWHECTAYLQRDGLQGRIDIGPGEIRVRAELGLMLGMLKATIQREIEQELDAVFAGS